MIRIRKATLQDVKGIARVCSEGYRETYKESHTTEYIKRIINEFYNDDRISSEITNPPDGWDGWYVALDGETVLGAIGGGTNGERGEVYVFYMDPNRRGEGIGTLLLNALTEVQKEKGATEQWVSVAKGNQKGIPFYEARGFIFQSEQASYANDGDEAYTSNRYLRKI